jgi:GT2 family glycosyltransferase
VTATEHSATGAEAPPRRTVSVVVVSYNVADWIVECLASLPAAATAHDLDVVVVDNASSDGSVDAVTAAFPAARLLRNDVNVGFGRAVNQGAAVARGDYVLLANPDGRLLPGAIDALVAFAEANPGYVITGGRTVTPDGDLDPRSCWAAPSLWSLASSALMLSALRPRSRWDPESMGSFARDHARPVDIVSGCLMLVRLDDWRRLGGFDERFFVYGEDAELCLRAAAVTGRRCAITPDAVMVHAVSASSSTKPDKYDLLLAGRITLLHTRWPARRAALGARLIAGGVALRAVLERLGVTAGRDTQWREVWRRRARWRHGFPSVAEQRG